MFVLPWVEIYFRAFLIAPDLFGHMHETKPGHAIASFVVDEDCEEFL
jgi:hypothetical protein